MDLLWSADEDFYGIQAPNRSSECDRQIARSDINLREPLIKIRFESIFSVILLSDLMLPIFITFTTPYYELFGSQLTIFFLFYTCWRFSLFFFFQIKIVAWNSFFHTERIVSHLGALQLEEYSFKKHKPTISNEISRLVSLLSQSLWI